MHELKHLRNGDYYCIIPESWKNQPSLWETLPKILEESLIADNTIYIDLVNVEEIRGDDFAILLNLASLAGRIRANLIFVGASELLEERIALLASTSE